MKGGADAALAGHAQPLLAADLGCRTLDLATGLCRVRPSATGGQLGDQRLVDHGLVRLDAEHSVLHVDLPNALAGQVNYLQLHAEASLSASSAAPSLPGTTGAM